MENVASTTQILKHSLEMDMKFTFNVARQTRSNTLYFLTDLNEDQINYIPEGFKNNIAWNLGHILVTYQLLVYRNSGLDIGISEEWVEKYRKGSSPDKRISMNEFESIKGQFVSLIDQAEADYNNGRFISYSAYSTSYGVDLSSVEEVFQFIYAHEALHWGVILALKKLV